MFLIKFRKILFGAFLIVGCTKTEVTTVVPNTEKNVVLDKYVLFGTSKEVLDYYANNDYKTIWKDSVNRADLIANLIDSQYDGVFIEKYPMKDLVKAHRNYNYLNYSQLQKADIKFSEVYFRLVKQLANGKVNPKKLYGDWEPYIAKVNFDSILNHSISNFTLTQGIDFVKPKSELYLKYKNAFAKYVPIKTFDTLNFDGYLQKKIWVNLERSKWLPQDLGASYVWVNLPEYKLKVINNNSVVAEHKVIIGKKERRTPVLSSAFNNIIINPKWTVPPTILKNDVVPKATLNRGYFTSERLTIYDKKTGKIVDPENWLPENYSNYRYVQKTGAQNSLGQIKFDFPNTHMVYLHDTNNRSRFNENKRSLSSGCVRVDDPFTLAKYIFQFEEKNILRSELDTLVSQEKTKSFPLSKKVNVHQVYFTATFNNDGSVKLLNDIYDLDNILYKRLIK